MTTVRSLAVILAIVICLAAAGLGGFALSRFHAAPTAPAQPALGQFIAADAPRPAPDAAFTDLAGKRVTLADFRGRFVLVNLWATWCAPCIREMPALDRLAAAMGGADFSILLVSQDRGGAAKVDPFFEKLGLTKLSTYLDPEGALGRAFGVRGLPTSVLIGRDGEELGRIEGAADWDGAALEATLRRYLAAGPKSAAR